MILLLGVVGVEVEVVGVVVGVVAACVWYRAARGWLWGHQERLAAVLQHIEGRWTGLVKHGDSIYGRQKKGISLKVWLHRKQLGQGRYVEHSSKKPGATRSDWQQY
jgi:hypothetical protein